MAVCNILRATRAGGSSGTAATWRASPFDQCASCHCCGSVVLRTWRESVACSRSIFLSIYLSAWRGFLPDGCRSSCHTRRHCAAQQYRRSSSSWRWQGTHQLAGNHWRGQHCQLHEESPAQGRHEAQGPGGGQWSPVRGAVLQAAHVLRPLQGLHLVRLCTSNCIRCFVFFLLFAFCTFRFPFAPFLCCASPNLISAR